MNKPLTAEFDADEIAWQAEQMLDRQRVDAARARLAAALRQAPDHAGLLLALARADYLDDRYDDARQAVHAVLRQNPADHSARWLQFCIEMEDGELPVAEQIILALLRQQPASAVYYAMYSRLMLRALHFEKADQLANEALRLAPNDDSALRARALCDLADGRRGRDNAALVRLIVADPQDRHTLRLVLVSLVNAGRMRHARTLAREMLRSQPDDAYLLQLVRQTHQLAHWSMLPLLPLYRWGWRASIGLWLVAVFGGRMITRSSPELGAWFTGILLAYAAYSWIWPPLFKRWMERKGAA